MLNLSQKLPDVEIFGNRHGFLVNFCAGKTVLHVGCVDAGLLEDRFAANQLLHQKLSAVCPEVWGTDIDGAGIEFLREKGFENLFLTSLSPNEVPERIRHMHFDVIVLSEVIEHLNSFQDMLGSLHEIAGDETRLVVTAPNAFSTIGIKSIMLNGVELVHPDHNCYFSSYTLPNLLSKHQWNTELVAMYSHLSRNQFLYIPKRLPRGLFKQNSGGSEPIRRLKEIYWAYRSQGNEGKGPIAFLGSLLLTSLMYSSSPHFADGVIAICRKSSPS